VAQLSRANRERPAALRRGGWRVLLVGMAACAALLLAGCQISQDAAKKDPFLQEILNAQNAQSATNSEAGALTATQTDATPHALGKPFQVDDTVWTVEGVDAAYSLQIGASALNAKGEFLVVRFLFQNISLSQQPPLPDMLAIETGAGKATHTYLPDAHATALYAQQVREPNFLTTTTRPNQTYRLALVFDIPVNSANLALRFHSYPNSNQNDLGDL
jgi:hypothetical protein